MLSAKTVYIIHMKQHPLPSPRPWGKHFHVKQSVSTSPHLCFVLPANAVSMATTSLECMAMAIKMKKSVLTVDMKKLSNKNISNFVAVAFLKTFSVVFMYSGGKTSA